MEIICRLILVLVIATAAVSCERKPQPVNSGTDDAKLRPELAASRKAASPTPTLDEVRVSPTPTP
jgi:hypothetical protein